MQQQQEPLTGVLRPDVSLLRSGNTDLLFDRQSDAYYKIAPNMLDVIAFLTRSLPVSEFLEQLRNNGIIVSRDELLQMLAFLQQNNLLLPEYGHIGVKRARQIELKEKTVFLRFSAAYLFFRLPPWRPEKFFSAIAPAVSWLASKWVLCAILIPSLIGYLLMLREFSLVCEIFLDSLSWAGLVKYMVAILFLKFVHESAHSLAAIHFNCRVRGIGLGFMVFYPRLYTDTTDSWRLPRNQRLLIDSAGIIMELLLGGIAALLWCYLPPGPWKSTMFYIFTVSTLSTLFVNGNPCIRYDGYYILCDLVNIENLMTRSGEYVKQFWRWHFLRLGTKPHHERGFFLLCFGVCSFVYRLFLYTSIVLLLYHNFVKAIAVVLVFLELYSIVFYPFWRELQAVRALSRKSANRARWILGFLVLSIVSAILFLPLSWNIVLPGEIIPSERSLVTVSEDGYLTAPFPRKARRVEKDDILLQLDAPHLELAQRRLNGTLHFDQTLLELQRRDEKLFSEILVTEKKTDSDRIALEELARRKNDLTICAPTSGIFVPSLPDLSTGAYLSRGLLLGEVVSDSCRISAYANDREIGRLELGDEARVYFRDALKPIPAKIIAIHRIASRLKNSPLLQHFGGPIPVYFEEKSPDSYSSVLPLYRIDLELEENNPQILAGRVVSIRIPRSEQLYLRLQQFLISMFRKEF